MTVSFTSWSLRYVGGKELAAYLSDDGSHSTRVQSWSNGSLFPLSPFTLCTLHHFPSFWHRASKAKLFTGCIWGGGRGGSQSKTLSHHLKYLLTQYPGTTYWIQIFISLYKRWFMFCKILDTAGTCTNTCNCWLEVPSGTRWHASKVR